MDMSFFVPGTPAPGGSKKAFFNKKSGRAMIVDAAGQRNKDWRASVVFAARDAMNDHTDFEPYKGELRLEIKFFMPRPKYHYNKNGLKTSAAHWHTKKPDLTKLIRSTEDALSDAGIWSDDAIVAIQHCSKTYADYGKTGAEIMVMPIVIAI